MSSPLTIALSKGRILDESLPLLARCGVEPLDSISSSRKLIFETSKPGVRVMVVRATDVPTYVEHGAAEMGFVGGDVLMEYESSNLYEPLDLGIARCRLMTAGPVGGGQISGRMRVATKFVNLTRRYYAERGQQVEIIKLYGSMELAPLVGLADRIVDLVDTGNTLKANGLEPLELIAEVSTRLVINKAAMKSRHAEVQELVDGLAAVTGEKK